MPKILSCYFSKFLSKQASIPQASTVHVALDLLERIQQHVARIGPATKTTLTRQQPEQLDLFDALNLKTPN